MNEKERRALEQAGKVLDILCEQVHAVWCALQASEDDNGIERNDAMVSLTTAHTRMCDAHYAICYAVERLA